MTDYKEIGHALQVEGNKTHVDRDFVNQYIQLPNQSEFSKVQGINLFNAIAKKNNLSELNDPLGYMVLDNSLYDYLHDAYQHQYEEHADMIDAGLMLGGSYGMNAVLGKLNKTIRHDITPYLPDKSVKYSDLRFIKVTPEMKETTDKFVTNRVKLTYLHGIKRSVEEETFKKTTDNMQKYGNDLKSDIAIAVGLVEKPVVNKLSKHDLLTNSQNNQEGLKLFVKQLNNPDDISKADDAEHATAQFITSDMQFAKFLISNKKYLKNFGFEIDKSMGKIVTSWQSETIDKLYDNRQNVNLDLSDLTNPNQNIESSK